MRPAHRVRHRRSRLRAIVAIGAVCVGMVGVIAFVRSTHRSKVDVVVDHDGLRQRVRLGGHPIVSDALAAAEVRPLSAHLLAVKSHHPIAGHDMAPALLLNGRVVGPSSVLSNQPDNNLVVVDAHDTTEPVVTKQAAPIPPLPLPRVIRRLWHPGQPGLADQATVGAISDELVSGRVITQPSAPMPVTDKVVALTFDDGPWPDTPQFLALLQQAGIKATFCMIGRQVLAHPQWVVGVAQAGMTVCNHTKNHNERLNKASPDVVDAEIQGGANALTHVLGRAPMLYRPPGGALSPLVENDADAIGEQVMGWNVDPSDYKRPGTDKIISIVMTQVRPGSIILLHDGGGDRSQTMAALPVIIAKLKAQGYAFTTPDAISPTASRLAGPPVQPGESATRLGRAA